MASKDLTSRIRWFSNVRGYGFLYPVNGGGDIIIHHSEVVRIYDSEWVRFAENDQVIFDLEMTPKGAKAVHVRRVRR